MGAIECRQFEEAILGAADVQAELAARPELAEHAAQCAKCGALLAQLQRLETQARALAVPDVKPSPAFLEQAAAMGLKRRRAVPRVIWIRRSAAAAIIVAAGLLALSLCLWNQRSAEAQTVLQDLVSWNLQLTAAHDPAERQRIYQDHAGEYKDLVAHAALPAGEQKIADGLLQNAGWLITENDRLSEAEHFAELAETVQSQEQAGGGAMSSQMAGLRNDLITGGVEENLKSVHPDQLSPPDRQRFNAVEQEIGSPASGPANGSGTQSGGASAGTGSRGLAAGVHTQLLVQPQAALPGPKHIISQAPAAGHGGAENSGGSNLLPLISGGIAALPRNNQASPPTAPTMAGDPRVSPPAVPQPAAAARGNPDDIGAMSASGAGMTVDADVPVRLSTAAVGDALSVLQNSGVRSDDHWTASPGGNYGGAIAASAVPPNLSHDGFAGGAAYSYGGGPGAGSPAGTMFGNDADDAGGFSSGFSGGLGGNFSYGASGPTNTGIFSGYTNTYGGFSGNQGQNSSHSRNSLDDSDRSASISGVAGESITDPTSFDDGRVIGTDGQDGDEFQNPDASANGPGVELSSGHNSGQANGQAGGQTGQSYGKSSGQPGGTPSGSQTAQGTASQTGLSGGEPSGQQAGQQSGQQSEQQSGHSGASSAASGNSGSAGPSSAIAGIAQGDSSGAEGDGTPASAWTIANGGYPQTGGGFADSKGDASAGQGGNTWNGNSPASDGSASGYTGGDSSTTAMGSSDSSWKSAKWSAGSSSGSGISPSAAAGNPGNPAPEPGAGLLLIGGSVALLLRRRGDRVCNLTR